MRLAASSPSALELRVTSGPEHSRSGAKSKAGLQMSNVPLVVGGAAISEASIASTYASLCSSKVTIQMTMRGAVAGRVVSAENVPELFRSADQTHRHPRMEMDSRDILSRQQALASRYVLSFEGTVRSMAAFVSCEVSLFGLSSNHWHCC
jgi:hypothetical protein